MEQVEIEELVGELETRIDRLRALYEQYFMGIERLEPLVVRKDVERRLQTLRKEQIRNSGLRFKFNVVAQRFNTYQTYWLRIARQIENGTYGRDVRRAKARFGVDPTKERAEEQRRASPPPPAAASDRRVIPQAELDELEDGSAFLEPLDVEDDPFAQIDSPAPAAPATRERFASAVRLELDDLADPFEEHDPFPRPVASPSAPKIRIAQRPAEASAPPQVEPRDTERRIPVAPPPRIAMRSGNPPMQGSAAPPPPGRGNESRVIISKRASIPDELERTPSRPVTPAVASPSPGLQRPATLPGAGPPLGRVSAAAPPVPPPSAPRVSAASVPVPPPSAPRVSAAAPPRVVPGRTAAGVSAPAVAPPAAPPSGPSVTPRAVPPPPAPAPAARAPAAPAPAARAPAPPAPAARAPAPPAPAAPPAARVGDLSGDRFGQIYSKYVETRRERNEPTHAITREALAKQLSDSTERLKQKHGGKPIDFEVVVKDGKTILRPVVK